MADRIPDFKLEMFFVEHGYEAHLFIGEQEVEVQCRDFAGSYPVDVTAENVYQNIAPILPDITEPRYTVTKEQVSLAAKYGYE